MTKTTAKTPKDKKSPKIRVQKNGRYLGTLLG